jgi:acetyltransferase
MIRNHRDLTRCAGHAPHPMPPTDPSHGLFTERAPLAALFAPRAVALVGASEAGGSVGRRLAENLAASGARWIPVNPRRQRVLGEAAVPSVEAVEERVDLAVIAVPAFDVPEVLAACGRRGVRAAAVVSAGFRESGATGRALEADALEAARLAGVRLLGPNSLGFVRPHAGINASLLGGAVRPGSVALLSQSGSLLSAVVDWGARQQMGFSAVVSLGSMADVGWGEAIDYFGSDPRTESILLYMESVGDARAFLSAAREVALQKPILVLRAGRTETTRRAVTSHTGALAGSDRVLDAALRRSGMLRVNTVAGLFYTAETLAKQPRPRGPRLAICSNAGGPALLAADALLEDGGELAQISDASRAALPPKTAAENPIDLLHDADAERYQAVVAALADDPGVDAVLAILTPQLGLDPLAVAEHVAGASGRSPCWRAGSAGPASRRARRP